MKAEKIGYSKDPVSIDYMKRIKDLFDPKKILNPYKVSGGDASVGRADASASNVCARMEG